MTRLFAVLALLVAGCASVNQLNDPSKPSVVVDRTTYEYQERDGIGVGYNVRFGQDSFFTGYHLKLFLRNNRSSAETLRPKFQLQDAAGLLIQPYSYDAFIAYAAAMAGTEVPPMSVSSPTRYYHSGTVLAPSGNVYSYSGYTTSAPAGGFAAGLAQGMAQGAAARAAADRNAGRMMLQWAPGAWLREEYPLPSGAAAQGELLLPAQRLGALPLKLVVEVNGLVFDFRSVGPR